MEHICNCIYVQHGQRTSTTIVGVELVRGADQQPYQEHLTFPYWGNEKQGVRPKGEYGPRPLRADQFCMLDT